MRILKPLDRYIFGSFLKIFAVTALGFPLLVIAIDATDNLRKYLGQNITPGQLALSYLYYIPESLFMALPAAVLFATVFTIGTLTRHSEVTAAKASGISFYRLIVPIGVGAALATGVGLVVGELVPIGTARRNVILAAQSKSPRADDSRYGFAYASTEGRVYTIGKLSSVPANIQRLEIRRGGMGKDYPTTVIMADVADWKSSKWWYLQRGVMHILPTDSTAISLSFVGLRDRAMTESPRDLLQRASQPDEMRREELGKFIAAMQRSGVNVNPSRVDRMLRIAIPVTCLIIFLFGAPLATSNQRGGAAFGVGIALGTTVMFLMLVQLTKAVGNSGVMPPELAAWIPSMAFGAAGLVLLARVRT